MDIKQRNAEILIEKQRQGLASCSEKIEKWKKIKQDYEILKSRLLTLADKLTYDAMVPFGTQAFMPGRIVNTNEILVLLGENWFVARSTKQAAQIAERRITWCNKMLEGLDSEKQHLENWIKVTAQVTAGQDLVEIVEDYDPKKEKEWQAKHTENVRAYHKKEAENRKVGSNDSKDQDSGKELTDAEIMERLNALELQEEEEEESDNSSDDVQKDSSGTSKESIPSSESKKNVRWSDQEVHCPVTITFKHSLTGIGLSSMSTTAEGDVILNSPSDIYNHFYKVDNIKPILKVKAPSPVDESKVWSKCVGVTGACPQEQPISSEQVLHSTSNHSFHHAFTGEIMERTPKELLENTASSSSKRPVSQFKKQRSKNK